MDDEDWLSGIATHPVGRADAPPPAVSGTRSARGEDEEGRPTLFVTLLLSRPVEGAEREYVEAHARGLRAHLAARTGLRVRVSMRDPA